MKALTLWQPWASLVALGPDVKPHETRGWWTAYRGPILIHAAKERPGSHDWIRWARSVMLDKVGIAHPAEPVPFGSVIAIANVVDLVAIGGPCGWGEPDHELDRMFGDWSEGRWAWTLENVQAMKTPVPWRGAQGLWTPPQELIDLVMAQLPSVLEPTG